MARGKRSTKKLLLAALALPLLGYLGLCGLMVAQQRDLMYYPQATRLDAIHTDFQLRRPDATLRGWLHTAGVRWHGTVRGPAGSNPLVLHLLS